eukprot:TRINITY_DN66613_c0_g1_i2.p3 TRINITY_DN66613_c0_g1~~TRINITY_DN66613_c0_g1_i2.p3  ORF type:complete len:150 (-),score=11.94 TRINITY_DN66613_c0_g1_i2:591-1040(-)
MCLETGREPVVTLCGHLFCWSCLYQWMRTQQHVRSCPCCKSGIDVDKVIPIYTRGSVDEDPRREALQPQYTLPPRPQGQRSVAVQRGLNGVTGVQQQGGAGVWSMLTGMAMNGNQVTMSDFTPEQQHQAFLSRLLLMLGSFVIMCLLLF